MGETRTKTISAAGVCGDGFLLPVRETPCAEKTKRDLEAATILVVSHDTLGRHRPTGPGSQAAWNRPPHFSLPCERPDGRLPDRPEDMSWPLPTSRSMRT